MLIILQHFSAFAHTYRLHCSKRIGIIALHLFLKYKVHQKCRFALKQLKILCTISTTSGIRPVKRVAATVISLHVHTS